jgi:pantothenate kinase-related protein Tda10
MDHTNLENMLHANLKEYMKNNDMDGFISDMALLLECHINDMEDCVDTLSDNVVEMITTA